MMWQWTAIDFLIVVVGAYALLVAAGVWILRKLKK
jgi:hypothetical protein